MSRTPVLGVIGVYIVMPIGSFLSRKNILGGSHGSPQPFPASPGGILSGTIRGADPPQTGTATAQPRSPGNGALLVCKENLEPSVSRRPVSEMQAMRTDGAKPTPNRPTSYETLGAFCVITSASLCYSPSIIPIIHIHLLIY